MDSGAETEDEINRTVWCGGIDSPKITEELLYELFLQAGPLEKVSLPKGKNYAFICFRHSVSVPYAVDLFKTTYLWGCLLKLKVRSGSLHERSQQQLSSGYGYSREQPYNNAGLQSYRQDRGSHHGTRGADHGRSDDGYRHEPYNSSDRGRDDRGWSGSSATSSRSEPVAGRSTSKQRDEYQGSARGAAQEPNSSRSGHYQQHADGYSSRRELPGDSRRAESSARGGGGKQERSDGVPRSAADARRESAHNDSRYDRQSSSQQRPESSRSNGSGNQSSGEMRSSILGDPNWSAGSRGLLGPLPLVGLLQPPFANDLSQHFVSFSNPPQGFFGQNCDPISLELRRQRVLNSQQRALTSQQQQHAYRRV